MTVQAVHLHVPAHLYRRLAEAADAAQQPLEQVTLQSIRAGLPPGMERVPEQFRADLRTLHGLSDELLWRVARSELENDRVTLYETLLEKNQRGMWSEADQTRLDTLRREADLLMLRRSYAYALLKWRGHRIPTLAELQVS